MFWHSPRTQLSCSTSEALEEPTLVMDDTTLKSLYAALKASPDNIDLVMVLVRAHLELDQAAEAAELVRQRLPEELSSSEQRCDAARALLKAGDPEASLAFAVDETAEAFLLRARSLLALDRHEEGRRAYEEAVRTNPTLEDPDLEKSLRATVRSYPFPSPETSGPTRLRVISNDDTDETEVNRLLMPEQPAITFAEVGGLDDIKQQIRRKIILPFQKPSLFQRFRKRIGGGILLYGPPGCGKTMLARATAGECDATFLSIAISDVLDMYIGESERKLHAVFEKARTSTPSVLFFDEVEALGGKRQYTREGTASKLVSQFLSEMDGFSQNNAGVLILGATNVPWAVDPAFRRPGRFDRVLFVPPPDREARRHILELLLRDRPTEEGIDAAALAATSSGFSGADLENLVETAVDEAIEESLDSGAEQKIRQAHLKAALKQVRPTTLEWLTTARNYARYANESGHYDEVLAFLKKHGKA
jgi:transitional endoplasmic reticulum ATPase